MDRINLLSSLTWLGLGANSDSIREVCFAFFYNYYLNIEVLTEWSDVSQRFGDGSELQGTEVLHRGLFGELQELLFRLHAVKETLAAPMPATRERVLTICPGPQPWKAGCSWLWRERVHSIVGMDERQAATYLVSG